MNSLAIVAGSNGYVGSNLTNFLLKNNYFVIGLGREESSKLIQSDLIETNSKFKYFCIKNLDILSEVQIELKKIISKLDYKKIIFINSAWNGENSVSGGFLRMQLENVVLSTNFIKLAKNLNCIKFIYLGSVLEDYLDDFLINKNLDNHFPFPTQKNYIFSKNTARDFNRLISYYEKIDYIHCKFSVFIEDNLNSLGYIHDVLKKISLEEEYIAPSNDNFFDFTILSEACKTIFLICEKASGNKTYYIGNSNPCTLSEYFSIFKSFKEKSEIKQTFINPSYKIKNFFDVKNLQQDIGYYPQMKFVDFAKNFFN